MKRSIAIDLAASVLGRGLTAGLLIIFTPVYLTLLGVEAYGLIGFYATLLATFLLFDQTVSPAVTRRFAQHTASASSPELLWNTFKTVEIIAVCMGLVLALGIFIAAPWIASHMLSASAMPPSRLLAVVRLMALMLAVQWPSFVYAAGLAGLGDQVSANVIRAVAALCQWLGGAVILETVSATVEALFAWQALCLLLQSLALKRRIANNLPVTTAPPRWSGDIACTGWRFSLGTLIIGFTGTVLTQADKLLVSKNVPLSDFAAYSLTFTMASLIGVFVAQPVMAVAYPHFTRLAAQAEAALPREYRRWTQLVVVAVVPPVGALVFYGNEILAFWLGPRADQVSAAALYLPWVAIGTMFNVLMMLPFNLQLAYGWTSLSARKNIIILPFFLVGLTIGIPRWGPVAGAIAWLGVNFSYYLFEVPFMHSRLLQHVLRDWWLFDTLLPCGGGLCAFWLIKTSIAAATVAPPGIGQCLGVSLIVGSGMLASLPFAREAALDVGRKLWRLAH